MKRSPRQRLAPSPKEFFVSTISPAGQRAALLRTLAELLYDIADEEERPVPESTERQLPAPLLLKPQDAGILLGVSDSTIRKLAREGKIPSMRIGESLRISYEGLREWVREQTTAGSGESHDHRNL